MNEQSESPLGQVTSEQTVLGGGCFWCLDAAFSQIDGIIDVIPGYAGGHTKSPSYAQVCSGSTGHAEVVRVIFSPATIDFKSVLDIFWTIHNPTTLNRQDYDIGTAYRSVMFFESPTQREIALSSKQEIQALWTDPVVTEITPLEVFYEAEDYHKKYFEKHPEQAYCQIIINPKLQKLRENFSHRLKPRH